MMWLLLTVFFFVFQVTFASLHSGHCMADGLAKCKDEVVCRFLLYTVITVACLTDPSFRFVPSLRLFIPLIFPY